MQHRPGPGGSASEPPGTALASRVVALVAIVLIVALTGLLYVAARPHPRVLALRFAAGSTLAYRLELTLTGTIADGTAPPSPYRLRLTEGLGLRVASAGPGGTAAVDVRVSAPALTVNGAPAAASPSATTLTVAMDGRILAGPDPSVLFGGRPGAGFPGLGQLMPVLPVRAVRPGDRWSRSYVQSFPFGTGSLPFTATGRLERYEDVGGVRAAVTVALIRVPVRATQDLETAGVSGVAGSPGPSGSGPSVEYDGRIEQRSTSWIDPQGQTVLRSDASGSVDLTMFFRNFPSLFPTFQPLPAAWSQGKPFGGGPGPAAGSSANPDTARIRGRFELRLQRLP